MLAAGTATLIAISTVKMLTLLPFHSEPSQASVYRSSLSRPDLKAALLAARRRSGDGECFFGENGSERQNNDAKSSPFLRDSTHTHNTKGLPPFSHQLTNLCRRAAPRRRFRSAPRRVKPAAPILHGGGLLVSNRLAWLGCANHDGAGAGGRGGGAHFLSGQAWFEGVSKNRRRKKQPNSTHLLSNISMRATTLTPSATRAPSASRAPLARRTLQTRLVRRTQL